ncbi:hypothetical protein CQ046_21465 [Chryseobacterium sp. MYb7]|uniref:hypothetical protein n=1 Tax=Chryseobacterium sp. MYb7 TaxID=1827290 RepID=UPI000D002224|nr:hypothetical protein [Chryseobacterium sp. MYb7]PRA97537.1 hypothetical protein CQ046_21465 [Chryseobacterium sp. MYb7]
MEGLQKIKLKKEKIHNLPLFFKTIYYNQVTNINDEMKLFKHNEILQCSFMRHYYSSRRICKTLDFKLFENEE